MTESTSKLEWLKGVPALNLTQREMQTLLCVFNYTNGVGENAYASADRIAADTGMNVRTAGRTLANLRERGIVVRRSRGGRNGSGAHWASVYALGSTGRGRPVDMDSQPDGAVPQPDGAVPQPDGAAGASEPIPTHPANNTSSSSSSADAARSAEPPAGDEEQQTPKKNPQPISSKWAPNKAHRNQEPYLDHSIAALAYCFKNWATGESVKRSDWNKTFGAFINCVVEGVAPDLRGFDGFDAYTAYPSELAKPDNSQEDGQSA